MKKKEKYKIILAIIFIAVISLSIVVRMQGISFITGDMLDFKNWFYELKNNRRSISIKRQYRFI